MITAEHLREAARVVSDGLTPYEGDDWSVRAGLLDWDVEQTIVHFLGALAKYTLYLASRSQSFLAVAVGKFSDATHPELIASIRPLAEGLASVAEGAPDGVRVFHASGLLTPDRYLGLACEEVLVHGDDALRGFGDRLNPPMGLVGDLLGAEHPTTAPDPDAWVGLLAATGRRY